MSAIGPGDWVQAVRDYDDGEDHLTGGAIYQVKSSRSSPWPCSQCGSTADDGFDLVGQRALPPGEAWCPCVFCLWPPPADESLRDEEAPTDERVTA